MWEASETVEGEALVDLQVERCVRGVGVGGGVGGRKSSMDLLERLRLSLLERRGAGVGGGVSGRVAALHPAPS